MPKKDRHRADGELFSLDIPSYRTFPVTAALIGTWAGQSSSLRPLSYFKKANESTGRSRTCRDRGQIASNRKSRVRSGGEVWWIPFRRAFQGSGRKSRLGPPIQVSTKTLRFA